LREKLSAAGIEPIGVIPDTPALSRAWLMGEPLTQAAAQMEMAGIMRALETAVAGDTLESKQPEPL
jgi:hypothetical protein